MAAPDAMTFGGHRPPSLEPKYEVTVKDKMLYHAITVQPAYENYSFEELRYASPALQRQSETMLVSKLTRSRKYVLTVRFLTVRIVHVVKLSF